MKAAIIMYIRNFRTMNDEQKLKAARLESSDERNLEISSKALRVSVFAIFIVLYCVLIMGGIYDMLIARIVMLILLVFCWSYILAQRYYSRKL